MSNILSVTWEVADGYVGGSRPHKTTVDASEAAYCKTFDEFEKLVEFYVQDDYDRLGFEITTDLGAMWDSIRPAAGEQG